MKFKVGDKVLPKNITDNASFYAIISKVETVGGLTICELEWHDKKNRVAAPLYFTKHKMEELKRI